MRSSSWHIVFTGALAVLGLVMSAPTGREAHAGNVSVAGAGGTFNVPVVSVREARFKKVVRQRYDFSCGSAAVATLLTYHYDRSTTEEEVFREMFQQGDQDKIRKEGFSLLDMKGYLDRHGIRANGYRVGLDKLAENGIPAIALINTKGYLHFVIITGVDEDEVLIADPALGNRIMVRTEFEKAWNGVLFVLLDNAEIAQQFFNHEEAWQVRTRAPMGSALMREGLAHFALSLPSRNEF